MGYCSKCGKQIDYDAVMCYECASADLSTYTQQYDSVPEIQSTPAPQKSKAGLASAIISLVLGIISVCPAAFSYAISYVCLELETGDAFVFLLAAFLAIVAIVMGAISLILGISAILAFKKVPAGTKKPVPSLILHYLLQDKSKIKASGEI